MCCVLDLHSQKNYTLELNYEKNNILIKFDIQAYVILHPGPSEDSGEKFSLH